MIDSYIQPQIKEFSKKDRFAMYFEATGNDPGFGLLLRREMEITNQEWIESANFPKSNFKGMEDVKRAADVFFGAVSSYLGFSPSFYYWPNAYPTIDPSPINSTGGLLFYYHYDVDEAWSSGINTVVEYTYEVLCGNLVRAEVQPIVDARRRNQVIKFLMPVNVSMVEAAQATGLVEMPFTYKNGHVQTAELFYVYQYHDNMITDVNPIAAFNANVQFVIPSLYCPIKEITVSDIIQSYVHVVRVFNKNFKEFEGVQMVPVPDGRFDI
jgi:hypothetical protein